MPSSRERGFLRDFDTSNPNLTNGLGVGDIVDAINYHPNPGYHLSKSNVSLKTLRDHQYKHTKARKQSSSNNDIKISNFRDSSVYGIEVKTFHELYNSSKEDKGKIYVRPIAGTGGPWEIAIYHHTASAGVQDEDANIDLGPGHASEFIDLDPYKHDPTTWAAVQADDKNTIVSNVNEAYIFNLGGGVTSYANWYKIMVYDKGTDHDVYIFGAYIRMGLDLGSSVYFKSKYHVQHTTTVTTAGDFSNNFQSWSTPVTLWHPGQDLIP